MENLDFRNAGSFFPEKAQQITTVEALAVADIVITADATSTIVAQARALGKPVFHINPISSEVSKRLQEIGMLSRAFGFIEL